MKTHSEPVTIMIIDDEPQNLNVLELMLSEKNWIVWAFRSGELALASARESPPDLVLLDIRMPDMDGFEVCRQFKADAALCTIPILFISALSAKEDIAAGFERGGVDYIVKPFRQFEVLVRVRAQLALRNIRRGARVGWSDLS
jgi:DNA-binding response OmpR family regulator